MTTTTTIKQATAEPLPTPLTVANDPSETTALWAMSVDQRVEAMWTGTLTLSQLCAWSSRRPAEVPLLGGEFAWIIMRTPEWDEPAAQRPGDVVYLPERRTDRAAA